MVASIFASQQPSFQDFLGATYLSPLSSPPADWGTVSYAYVTGSYIGNNGDPVVNANFRHVIVPVESYWQGVRVAGAYNIGSTLYFAYFLDDANNVLGNYLIGTGGNVTLSASGNGILPFPLPTGTTKIALNQRTTNTAFTIEAQSARVFVIGDSASASSTTGIGDDLATAYPTRTFYQQGIGGQLWMGHIRKRAGLANPLLTVTGGTIPSNGSAVACTFDLSFLIHTSTDVVTQVSVGQHRCAVRYLFASNSYTIAALDSPSADIDVVAATPVRVLTGVVTGVGGDPASCPKLTDMLTGSLWIVRSVPSINDKFSINYPNMEAAVDALIANADRYGAKLLLVGMMNGEKDLPTTYTGGTATTAANSASYLTYVDTMNSYMSAQAAANSSFVAFADVQALHISNSGSTVENVNGTNFNVLTSTAVNVKLSDYRHETTTVQATETVPYIQSVLDPLGW